MSEQQAAERMRVKQILHQAKVDIGKIFTRVENELCADLSAPAPIFTQIEQHFARPLSPFELEMVREWMDKQSPELIEAALREAATKNIRNVRYIDTILVNWERAGIKDAKAAIEHSARFRQKAAPIENAPPQLIEENRNAPQFYNWLEERG